MSNDWISIVTSLIAALTAGGWFVSRTQRKRDGEKHAVELERARAEADALRQRSELDYTKEILELYSAHIVNPLQDQINALKNRFDRYEYAISKAPDCRLYPDCAILHELQGQKNNDNRDSTSPHAA